MSRKSKKTKPVEEAQMEPPPAPEEVPPPAVEVPPEPVPEPEQVQTASQDVAPAPQVVTPLSDEELPPPPSDIAEQTKKFAPLKTRKPGIGASMRRTGAIFGKDLRTMSKHGLVSSIIVLALLIVIFTVSSYAMYAVVTTTMGDGDGNGGDGGQGGPDLGNDGSLVANAIADVYTINAGEVVAFDSSSTIHSANIMYVEWRIGSFQGQLPDDVSLYGPQADYKFDIAGEYSVELTVVDAKWNMDNDNLTITVDLNGADSEAPYLDVWSNHNPSESIPYGTPLVLDASNSTDNIGVVNYTWMFSWRMSNNDTMLEQRLYGPVVSHTFDFAGNYEIYAIIRDDAGNFANRWESFEVSPSMLDTQWPNAKIGEIPESVTIGTDVQLQAIGDNQGMMEYTWYVSVNNTRTTLTGGQTSFTPQGFGMYDIILVVKNQAGNAATDERQVLAIAAGMDVPSMATWASTPFGQEIPFTVLTFVYGAALLACVIFIGGLFSKGLAHEIQKGTAKTLFFAPISVTNMLFAKLLYPLAISPIFIFPLMMISTIPLHQDMQEVFTITLVSYLMTAAVLVSAAYGSCLLFAATKRMSIKPSALARMFMYLSLIATLAVFIGLAFMMDQFMGTDLWTGMSAELGSNIAMFSPFHQGGILLSNMLLGTTQSLDWIVFVIPMVLIAGGVIASRKLFPDLFSRE